MEPIHNGPTVGEQGGTETTSAKTGRPVERRKTFHQQQGLLGQYGHPGAVLSNVKLTHHCFLQRNSFDVDQHLLVCGLSHVGEGGVKVILSRKRQSLNYNVVQVVDRSTEKIVASLDHSLPNVPKEAVKAIVLTPKLIVSLTSGGNLFVWSRDSFQLVASIRNAHPDPHAELEACGDIVVLNSDYRIGVACKIWRLVRDPEPHLTLVGSYQRPRSLPSRVVLDANRIGIVSENGVLPTNMVGSDDIEIGPRDSEIEIDYQSPAYMHFLTHSLQPKEVLNTGTKAVHFNLDKCFALQGRLFAMAGNDASSEEVNDEEIFMRSNNIRIWNIETGRLLQEIVTDKVPLNGNHDCQQFSMCIQLFLKNNFLYMNKIGMTISNKSPCLSQELQWCCIKSIDQNSLSTNEKKSPPEPLRTLTLEPASEGAGSRKGRVAIDETSIVHVGDMGDVVTTYQFWV